MLFCLFGKRLSSPAVPASQAASSSPTNGRRGRRGATAMEYLFVLSLIIVIAITGINYFAQMVKDNLQNSSDTIKNAQDGNK